jgi:hypothetical protein
MQKVSSVFAILVSQVDLVVDAGRTNHQALNRRIRLYNRMKHTAWKATELAWANANPLSGDLDHQTTTQHDKTFIALGMGVRSRVVPSLICLVIPNLKALGGETYAILWRMPDQER